MGMGMGTGGIPTTDNTPETTEKLGCPKDNILETTEKLGCPTDNLLETTDFLKNLILSYSLKIKLNTCKNKIKVFNIF
jgi:hypothetical protein